MSDVKPLTPDQEKNLRAWAKKYAGPNSYALTWLDLFATLDAERARADAAEAAVADLEAARKDACAWADAALLEGVKAGIEAAAKYLYATDKHTRSGMPSLAAKGGTFAKKIKLDLDPAAIARQVREGKRDA